VTVWNPSGWNSQKAIAALFPATVELRHAAQREVGTIEARLDREEGRGRDMSCLRQIVRELRWRLEYTADEHAIRAALERMRAVAALPSQNSAATPAEDGSFAACTDVWFLKLEASVDYLLAADYDDRGRAPHFLNRVNDPGRLRDYLDSLLISRPAEDGIDRRKELNLATANLVRLILWRRPSNYLWDARVETVIRRFITEWQDPISGFFGATYLVGGRRLHTTDLSLTFHMARYLEGSIGYWPELIDTLIGMRDSRYPHGWLDEIGMTSHNNYDVAILFRLGWPHMRADQRRRGAQELGQLLDWCLTSAVAQDGHVTARAIGESLPESYYFTIAFLDAIGYFDRERFWTERAFPEAPAVRARLEDRLLMLPRGDPMGRMAHDRLRRSTIAAGLFE
jgi:hypothetical protein